MVSNKWYTEAEFKATWIKQSTDLGMSQQDAEEFYNTYVRIMFEKQEGTYTLSGNTLTLTINGGSTVYTRQ